jgi:hypothetical protein
MALSLIGAGFGRTGTLSLKVALERLGLGRCYHMTEVFAFPEHARLWHAAALGERIEWDALLGGYGATVDWPGCFFWRALADLHPAAKVLLSVREPRSWHRSVMDTIYKPLANPPLGAPAEWIAMAREIVLERTFQGRLDDAEHAIAVYERHNRDVQRAIPPERLLVYEASEGWAPLCRFLGLPVPAEPFPRVNTTEEFRARLAQAAPSSTS